MRKRVFFAIRNSSLPDFWSTIKVTNKVSSTTIPRHYFTTIHLGTGFLPRFCGISPTDSFTALLQHIPPLVFLGSTPLGWNELKTLAQQPLPWTVFKQTGLNLERCPFSPTHLSLGIIILLLFKLKKILEQSRALYLRRWVRLRAVVQKALSSTYNIIYNN